MAEIISFDPALDSFLDDDTKKFLCEVMYNSHMQALAEWPEEELVQGVFDVVRINRERYEVEESNCFLTALEMKNPELAEKIRVMIDNDEIPESNDDFLDCEDFS